MEKTSIVILGDNIVSNILKFLLKKAGVNFINVALPGKPHSKRYFAIKPSFIDWFSKTLDFKLAESYLIKKIKIFSKLTVDLYIEKGDYNNIKQNERTKL